MSKSEPLIARTLGQIATEVGVSIQAVSLALRDKEGVSSETKQEIKEAARRLRYRVDPCVSMVIQRKRRANASMRLVAERAGVSLTTTSLALRDGPGISEKTKSIVREAAQAVGYQLPKALSDYMATVVKNRYRKDGED